MSFLLLLTFFIIWSKATLAISAAGKPSTDLILDGQHAQIHLIAEQEKPTRTFVQTTNGSMKVYEHNPTLHWHIHFIFFFFYLDEQWHTSIPKWRHKAAKSTGQLRFRHFSTTSKFLSFCHYFSFCFVVEVPPLWQKLPLLGFNSTTTNTTHTSSTITIFAFTRIKYVVHQAH